MGFQLDIESDLVRDTVVPIKVFAQPETPVADVLREMRAHETGNVMIIDDSKLVGIFTERDALRLMAGGESLDQPVKDAMADDPVTVSPGDSVAAAVTKMSDGGYRRLPVVGVDGQATGCVKSSGILRYLVEHFPQEIYNLPPDPHQNNKEREGA